jgi:3-methylfumaryl-CoA hydratase
MRDAPPRDRVARRTELITHEPAEALAGLLDIEPPAAAGTLPPLWHWVSLRERRRESELGPDGHPTRGIPAPPGPGRLRMFAGGRLTVHNPLRFGEPASRASYVLRSVDKQGRSGSLTFVTVRSEIAQAGALAVREDQDIVYRTAGGVPSPASPGAVDAAGGHGRQGGYRIEFDVDPVLLFRFSALTYNAHRIHYDKDYAIAEGYPDIVVHGPLQALLMAETMRRSGVPMRDRTFAYRLVAPTYGAQRLTVTARHHPDGADAQVRDGAGSVTATSTLTAAHTHPPAA